MIDPAVYIRRAPVEFLIAAGQDLAIYASSQSTKLIRYPRRSSGDSPRSVACQHG